MSRRVVVLVCFVFCVAGTAARVHAACDTTPPNLTGFSFAASAINTTSASQSVTCTMTVTDDLAGTTEANCLFQSPTFQQSRSCTATAPISGTSTNGTFECSITFPRYSQAGSWTALVTLGDAVGNAQTVFPQFLAFPFLLTVTSDSDVTGPALTTFVHSPTTVNVSAAGRDVTCTMTVTDAKSGVEAATCFFQAPQTDQFQACISTAPSSGTRNNGTFECTFTMPRYSDQGNWTRGVFLIDLAGNFSSILATETLLVLANPQDILAPSLTNFSITPTSVDVGSGSQMVSCTMEVADDISGVGTALCRFTSPSLQSQECVATAPTSGTRTSGTFECSVSIPRYSAGGLWDTDVELTDLVGNVSQLPQPEQLTVSCAGGSTETTCRFADKTTLTWDAVAGATQYNVYRGTVSGLTDANQDHLPDGGYGTCRNSTDPNLTDTTFTDNGTPTTGQKGFHYLVSYTAAAVEQGLGSNSFGDPRTVVTPCP